PNRPLAASTARTSTAGLFRSRRRRPQGQAGEATGAAAVAAVAVASAAAVAAVAAVRAAVAGSPALTHWRLFTRARGAVVCLHADRPAHRVLPRPRRPGNPHACGSALAPEPRLGSADRLPTRPPPPRRGEGVVDPGPSRSHARRDRRRRAPPAAATDARACRERGPHP